MLNVFNVQDWGSLMHASKQAWWEWIHPFCLWVCFGSLRYMKECLIQASKQSMITSPPTVMIFVCCFCYNSLPRLKPGVFCSWKQEWYIIIILLLSIAVEAGMFFFFFFFPFDLFVLVCLLGFTPAPTSPYMTPPPPPPQQCCLLFQACSSISWGVWSFWVLT